MTAVAARPITFTDYIAFEKRTDVRHEFEDGRISAMAGGTPEHAAMVSAVHLAIGSQLGSGCRTFVENLRVRTPSGTATYPDVLVVCGPLARDPADDNTVTNPHVIVEVLSESTEVYDRGKKFAHYRSCPSFVEYVMVASQGAPLVERFVKQGEVWTIARDAGPGDMLRLASLDVVLDVDQLYAQVLQQDGTLRVV